LEKTVPEQFFSSKWSKTKSFENGLDKIYRGAPGVVK
jgi:hypothetical protein